MARSATQQPTALWLFVLLVVLVSSPSITLATGDAVVKDLAFRRAAERHDGGGRTTEPPQPMQLSVLVETVDGRVVSVSSQRKRERERSKTSDPPPECEAGNGARERSGVRFPRESMPSEEDLRPSHAPTPLLDRVLETEVLPFSLFLSMQHAFDALSGERLWTSRAGGALVTTSISSQRADDVAPKSAIVPGVDGHLYSIKAGSRAIRRLGVHATDVVRVSLFVHLSRSRWE